MLKDVCIKMEPSWHYLQRQANQPYSRRTDTQCMRFKERPARRDITDGYYSAHESRFTRSNASFISDPVEINFDKRHQTGRTTQLFQIPHTEPLPIEGKRVTHGGQYYDVDLTSRF